jgi:hypothetical protein
VIEVKRGGAEVAEINAGWKLEIADFQQICETKDITAPQ